MAQQFKREFHCSELLWASKVKNGLGVQEALRLLAIDDRRLVMTWVSKGPFWETERRHGGDDYLECGGDLVTDTAVGEAAYRILNDLDECGLVSFSPSKWCESPINVTWKLGEDARCLCVEITNWTDPETMEAELVSEPITLWHELRSVAPTRFPNLRFSDDCFNPLCEGVPFARSSADRILKLLRILDRYSQSFDSRGKRTPEGDRLYQNHFVGDSAWFSDSSDREKRKFRQQLTFSHPITGKPLFCPWHGKIPHHVLRLHFSWPEMPIHVVYVGPKITKR